MPRTRRNGFPSLTAAVAAAALLLTACNADDGEDPSPEPTVHETSATDAQTGVDGDALPVTVAATFIHGGIPSEEVTVEVEVGPIVRDGDLAALAMEFVYLEGDSSLSTLAVLSGLVGFTDNSNAGGQVRLVDAEQMTVAELARTEQMIAADGSSGAVPGEPLSWLGYFDAPRSDQVAVLMPHYGLVPDVPVIDGDLSDVKPGDDSLRTFADYDGVAGQTHDLIAWRETPHYLVDIEGEETTISLPSDVLFDVDSAELSVEAEEALQAAAAEMEGTEGGELSIIGHTDNVLDEEYNQALSEERAEAVRERLTSLTDLGAFDEVKVSGESFRLPIAENSSEDGRALNRRVELHFTTVAESGGSVTGGELPAAEGPVSGANDVLTVVAQDGREAELSVESLERLDNLVVAGIRVESRSADMTLRWPLTTGIGGAGILSQVGVVDLPYLASGDQWVHPLRYFPGEIVIDEENPEDGDVSRSDYRILADAMFGGTRSWEPGQSSVAYLIYPDLGADELTLESPAEHAGHSMLATTVGVNPWRFANVPVSEIGAGD